MPEPETSSTGEEAMTPQRLANVGGDLKNRSYINSGASIHNLFTEELLVGMVKLDRVLNIRTGAKPIHLSRTRSLHQALQHLPLPISTYHYNKNSISNFSSFTRHVNKYYTIYKTRDNDVLYKTWATIIAQK